MGFVENIPGKIDVAERGNETQIFIRLVRHTIESGQIATTSGYVEKTGNVCRRNVGIGRGGELSGEQQLRHPHCLVQENLFLSLIPFPPLYDRLDRNNDRFVVENRLQKQRELEW